MSNTPSDKKPDKQAAPGGGKPPDQNKTVPAADLTKRGGGIKPS
jgi:hypothetical protein